MKIKSLKALKNLAGKRVFLRADFNVPMEKSKILDDYKITAGLETIKFLSQNKCRTVVASHFGRPEGGACSEYSLTPVYERLRKYLGKKVKFVQSTIGYGAWLEAENLAAGEVLLLENLRFYEEEEKNDRYFARSLAQLADIYVNDAFAVSHRAHASVAAIKKFLPAYAGLLLEKEIVNLEKCLQPEKPFCLIVGGAKIETKLPIFERLGKKADYILVGGVLIGDFISALGYEGGRSAVNKHDVALAKKINKNYAKVGSKKIIMPLDVVASRSVDGRGKVEIKKINKIKKDEYILDIGPETIKFYRQFLRRSRTIVWNGPLGVFEKEKFRSGTVELAKIVAAETKNGAFTLVGGGETVAAVNLAKAKGKISWVSTGGGALLSYLGREKMPGLKGIVSE